MPEGLYLSVSGSIRAGTGGQTRALLMRNRLFTQHAGIDTTIVTFDPAPVYPEVRDSLTEQGQLVPGMRLLNLYEWYRNRPTDFESPSGSGALPEPQGFVSEDELHPDGSVYITKYLHKRSRVEALYDYRRPDGTVFLRTPAGPGAERTPATKWILTDHKGAPLHSWSERDGLHRSWLLSLAAEAERVFVISDSRFALRHVVPMKDPRFHIMHLMHNTHTVGGREWNSPLSRDYGPLLESIPHLDGLVTLTRRQREDVIQRQGPTNNLFVVPNPVELPELPEPLPEREPARFAIVSRLERQKRLHHAIRAFALVLEREPGARLDIYGDGALTVPLQNLIDRLGVAHRVSLCGHSPHARTNLLASTAFLMTSLFEGYPLASLESLSHGCPVISYDIKYGPREQITDGVDGLLVPPGDIEAFADRVVELIRNPALVERMSKAAYEKAQQHDYRAFLADWRGVIDAVIANKPDRVTLTDVDVEVRRLQVRQPSRVSLRGARPGLFSQSFDRTPSIEVQLGLFVRGKGRPRTLPSIVVALDAVCDRTGTVARVPVEVTQDKRRVDVRASFDLADLFTDLGDESGEFTLRLRVTWNNASWETTLGRPAEERPPFELSYGADGTLLVSRLLPGGDHAAE